MIARALLQVYVARMIEPYLVMKYTSGDSSFLFRREFFCVQRVADPLKSRTTDRIPLLFSNIIETAADVNLEAIFFCTTVPPRINSRRVGKNLLRRDKRILIRYQGSSKSWF